ncbi:hypothetical protein RND81_08G055800 [Saponaria officinalis]|uniref:Uncharacterized protein n=1 Tax=Saponaria officinalis TaxID=3572 RepID=A0AAW1J5G6_SAPOF
MATPKQKKSSQVNQTDIQSIQNDAASFASSVGLSSSSTLPSSGFNDTDFRPKKMPKPKHHNNSTIPKNPFLRNPKFKNPFHRNPKFKNKIRNFPQKSPKMMEIKPSLDFDTNNSNGKSCERFKNLPKLPW